MSSETLKVTRKRNPSRCRAVAPDGREVKLLQTVL